MQYHRLPDSELYSLLRDNDSGALKEICLRFWKELFIYVCRKIAGEVVVKVVGTSFRISENTRSNAVVAVPTERVVVQTFIGDLTDVNLYSKLSLICRSLHANYRVEGTRIILTESKTPSNTYIK